MLALNLPLTHRGRASPERCNLPPLLRGAAGLYVGCEETRVEASGTAESQQRMPPVLR